MKVYICSTFNPVEDLSEEYPCLKDFGFVMEDVKKTRKIPINDENGDIIMQEVERIVHEAFIFIDSIEDLGKLYKAVGVELIFYTDRDHTCCIELYDGCRE